MDLRAGGVRYERVFPTIGTALALTALAAPSALGAPAGRVEMYTNLKYIAEADDYVGLNLRIRRGITPSVDYELCEGWCNGSLRFPATIEGSTIRFTVRQPLWNEKGQPAEPTVYRVVARKVQTKRGLRMVVTSPDQQGFREVLKPTRFLLH